MSIDVVFRLHLFVCFSKIKNLTPLSPPLSRSFPLWRNAETGDQLKVTPKKGKAVLFYSLLPDGNYDDLSIHASLPVTKGEKWLANLWVSFCFVFSLSLLYLIWLGTQLTEPFLRYCSLFYMLCDGLKQIWDPVIAHAMPQNDI